MLDCKLSKRDRGEFQISLLIEILTVQLRPAVLVVCRWAWARCLGCACPALPVAFPEEASPCWLVCAFVQWVEVAPNLDRPVVERH